VPAANGSAAGADIFFGKIALADVVAILVAEGTSFRALLGSEEQVGVVEA